MKRFLILILIFTLSWPSEAEAQLAETNIKISTVKQTLGASTYELSDLATHVNVNKWSRKKPVEGTWPESAISTYGLNLSTNWSYTKPTSEYRLGDFRGYQQNATIALPPIHTVTAEFSEDDLFPSASPSSNNSKIRAYNSTSYTSVIIPSLLGLDGYYYGIRLTQGGSWFRTFGLVSALPITGLSAWISTTMTEPGGAGTGNWEYVDCPQIEGAVTFQLIVSNTAYSDWTFNPTPTYYVLPSGIFGGIIYKSDGSFFINSWLEITPEQKTWDGVTEETEDFIVSIQTGETWVFYTPIPTWLNVDVGHIVATEWVPYPSPYPDQAIIRIYPDEAIDTERSVDLFLARSDNASVALNDIGLVQEFLKTLPTVTVLGTAETYNELANVQLGLPTISWSFDIDGAEASATISLGVRDRIEGGAYLPVHNVPIQTIDPLDAGHHSGSFVMDNGATYNEEYQVKIIIN